MNHEAQNKTEKQNNGQKTVNKGLFIISLLISFVAGFAVCGVIIINIMPGMMIVTKQSKTGVEQTVNILKERIDAQGWELYGGEAKNLNASLAKNGVELKPQVRLVGLCKPEYAKDVLLTDRYVSTLMPCRFAVWEGDDGKTYVSKMNMSLMARMFGGNIAEVMGKKVVKDEEQILEGLFIEQ